MDKRPLKNDWRHCFTTRKRFTEGHPGSSLVIPVFPGLSRRSLFEYLNSPHKINGTLYRRADLPTAPIGKSQGEAFAEWLDAVPKAQAKAAGFDANEVRMVYDPSVRAYRGMVAGLPLTNADGLPMVVSKESIKEWQDIEYKKGVLRDAARGAARMAERARQLASPEIIPVAKQTDLRKSVGTRGPKEPLKDWFTIPDGSSVQAPKTPPRVNLAPTN